MIPREMRHVGSIERLDWLNIITKLARVPNFNFSPRCLLCHEVPSQLQVPLLYS